MKKVIHYINQFYAGIGGEDKATTPPMLIEGVKGPGMALEPQLNDADITYTIVCGDDFMNENTEEAINTIKGFLDGLEFDLFVAGPAFFAGRYGTNCGRICDFVTREYGVKAVTCMYKENPGVEMFRKNLDMYIMEGGDSAARMRKDIPKVARVANKLLAGEMVLWASEEGYFPHGKRAEIILDRDNTTNKRAFNMLMAKLKGEAFETESPIEMPDVVPVAKPVEDPETGTYVLVSTGGVVPMGNPDRITTGTADHYGVYDITGVNHLEGTEWESVHGGYDHAYANINPHTHLPVDALRKLESMGKIGHLYDKIFSTVGNLNSETNAKNMAQGIIRDLADTKIAGIIFGSA